ncbi:Protein of unknown function [Bradyrhizobium lablabi]|uniref:DUF3592 domain-containing protein n=1 Tax=Bradyrhizobium lablabi TaxID=722472 RepID=A0A1M7BSU8_9BRAD|nr:DUF3592 domain-containing protein [Bradyrhizobium lablabi]SHL57936.1 Protein of unknown function [Bradyrhizobium lablabi]
MLSANALLWTRIGALVAFLIAANLVYALWKARRQASSIRQWLIVPGEIIACEVTAPKVHTSDEETDCSVNLRYRYRVGLKDFEGSHIHAGREAMTTRLLAEQTAAKYPVGSRVDVHYRENHPATSVLEPKDPRSLSALIAFLALFAWIALVLVVHSIAGHVLLLRDGGVPFFALMLPIGCTVIGILGLRSYLQTRRKLQSSAKWPTAAGTITDSEVIESQNTETDDKGRETVNTEYRVDIRFAYKVGLREFHSSNWKWGWTAIYRNREKPEKIVAAHPAGKSVQVFYDPNEPATAVLEPANPQGTFVQFVFSFVFGGGGLLMFWVLSKLGEGG